MKSKLFIIAFMMLISSILATQAQVSDTSSVHNDTKVIPPKAVRGSGNSAPIDSLTDYVLSGKLTEFEVVALREFNTKRQQSKYYRLVASIKKVYPYAQLAGERMKQYGDALNNMSKKERKDLVKAFEDELKYKHGADLKKMTFTQGRILLKLVDRETANTPYDIVKDLKGSFQAFFWNSIASLFDYNLKEDFDPQNNQEDMYIDEICKLIDMGLL